MRKAIILILLAFATLCAAKYNVVGFSLSFRDDSTVAEVITDGPTEIKTIELEDPDRLIIDLIGGVHRLKTEKLPPLPKSVVVEMRSAQFQADPEPITRIVLVLAEPIDDVRIETEPRGGKVIIPTPGYPSFDFWSIGRETPAAPPAEPEPPETETTEKQPQEPEEEKTVEVIEAKAESIATQVEAPAESVLSAVTYSDSAGSNVSFVRPMVDYQGTQYRDPFVIAEPRKEQELGEEAIPIVNDLTLVGVVKDGENDYLGIMQDRKGWGYILGIGDTVVNGNVVAVTDSSIRFEIEEFGVTRPVDLQLLKENN